MSRLRLLLPILVLGGLLGGHLAWIDMDRIVRDGDEEGHVGAAELVAAAWMEGRPGEATLMTFSGDLGEYPPLYPGLVGGAWAFLGGGNPARLALRGLNLLGIGLAALSVGLLARPLGARAAWVAVVAVLLLPLPSGLSRHFMPEGALVGAVALAVLVLEDARRRPTVGRLVLLGLVLGLGFLVKQTFILCLAPLMLLRIPWRPRSLLSLGTALLVVIPWLLPHLAAQERYGLASIAGPGGIPLLRHLVFYPWTLFWVGAGPALTLLLVWAPGDLVSSRDDRHRDSAFLAIVWLVGGIVVLTALPRKDPRLLAPLLPALGLLAACLASRPRGLIGAVGLLACAAGWWGWGSWRPLPIPSSAEALDARCAQRWFRPPIDDDLGFGEVVAAARGAPPGPVLVLDSPIIPCDLRATFDWAWHLGPALRRGGADRPLITEGGLEGAGRPALVLSWHGAVPGYQGHAVPVEALEGELWIGEDPGL